MDGKTLGNLPANPLTTEQYSEFYSNGRGEIGLTIRQAAAIAAMQGMLSNPDCGFGHHNIIGEAVNCADRLLVELAKDQV